MTMKWQYSEGPVVLVSRPVQYTFPLGYAYLAGYLHQRSEEVRMIFRHDDLPALVRQIMATNPLLVGFGNLYPDLPGIAELVRLLDLAGRRFPIVIGGQMVSPIPEFAVRITGADFGVIGEGEIVLHQLVCALREGREPSGIGGLAIREGDQVHLTGPGLYIADLSKLPPIPYELFPKEEWLEIGRWYDRYCPQPHWRHRDRVINVHGGRGCPFQCNFCYHHSRPRYRPVDLMLAEAKDALIRFDGNMLDFSDDLVLGTPKRAGELVAGLRTLGRQVECSVSTRFDIMERMDDNLLAEMKAVGCRIMGLGIESGSDRILQIVGKNCTSSQILRNLSRLKRVGILPTVSIMVGQFDETVEDAEASVKLMLEAVRENPNIQFAFTVTTPFPGSPLYKHIMERGLLSGDQEFYDKYFARQGTWNMVVNLSRMTDEEVWGKYEKLNSLYLQERDKRLGRGVAMVSALRSRWRRFDHHVERRLDSLAVGRRPFEVLKKGYKGSREFVSRGLEKLELRARGI